MEGGRGDNTVCTGWEGGVVEGGVVEGGGAVTCNVLRGGGFRNVS